MDAIFAYVSHALACTLFLCLTFASSFVLLKSAKRSLKQDLWVKSHLASLLSILCLLPTALTIFAWQTGEIGKGNQDALLFATIVLCLPVVAAIVGVVLAGIAKTIPPQYSFPLFPSFKIASASLVICVLWSFVFSLQTGDWEDKYAQYGTDMQKVMQLYDKCGDRADCFGIAYAIVQNTHATPEVIESVADRSEHITIICIAVKNPNVSKAFIEKWTRSSGIVKQCADQALSKWKVEHRGKFKNYAPLLKTLNKLPNLVRSFSALVHHPTSSIFLKR